MYSLFPFTILFYIICSQNIEPIQGELIWEQLGEDIFGENVDDRSGYSVSVAMSGNGARIAIGGRSNDGNGDRSGHVRIYQFQDSWEQLGEDIDGEAVGDRSGWSVAMSDDGSRIAIGAPGNDGNGSNSGHVRVYEFQGSWEQLGADIDFEATYDDSNSFVAMSGDGTRIAIGAPNEFDTGHVRVYQFQDSWEQLGEDINGEGGGDRSGWSVAMSGDGSRIAIGATRNDGNYNGLNMGHVRVYAFQTSWEQIGYDIDGEVGDDNSGQSVAMSGDGSCIAIGAPGNDDNGLYTGHVRVYKFQDSWEQLGEDIDGEAAGDRSGWSVAMSDDGTRIAIGAKYNNGNGDRSDHVRLYQFQDSWEQLGADIDGEDVGDRLALPSVAMSDDGTRIAVGSQYNDGNGYRSSHLRIFQGSSPTDNPTSKPIYPPTNSPTSKPIYPPTNSPTNSPTTSGQSKSNKASKVNKGKSSKKGDKSKRSEASKINKKNKKNKH